MALRSRYTPAQFQQLIQRESDRIELKTGVGQTPLQEAMVALSNTEGGVIFVGVQDDGRVVGKPLDQGTEERIHEAALATTNVGRYRIIEVQVGPYPVVAISVERRVEGFAQTSNGRVLVRRGARNVALFGGDLARLINDRALTRFELTPTHLEFHEARPDLLEQLSRAFDWSPDPDSIRLRLAEKGLLTHDDHFTVAGALFLTDPRESLRQNKAIIEIRRYPEGAIDYDRRTYFGGPLQEQVVEATKFITDEVGSDLVVTGLYRHDLPRLPEVVVREVIANAVAHRSYEAHGSSVLVELHPDRAVVSSPGGLPEPVTVENLRQAQSARNQDVIDVLRRFRLAEDAGRGIDVIEDTMQEALLDPPTFEDLGHAVRVTLPLRGPITPRERAWISDLERRGEISGRDRLLLVHAARGERLTNARARELLGVDRLEARNSLQRLRDAELLEQHGTRGGAAYTLVEEIAPPAAFRMGPRQLEDLVVAEARRRPLSNEMVRQLTGLERRPALRLLRHLVGDGRLRRSGERRGTRYTAR